jgi:hypothetical protein
MFASEGKWIGNSCTRVDCHCADGMTLRIPQEYESSRKLADKSILTLNRQARMCCAIQSRHSGAHSRPETGPMAFTELHGDNDIQ